MKKLACLFTSKSKAAQKPTWGQWHIALCKHPSTISFRLADDDDRIFKTVNSVYLDISDDNNDGSDHDLSPCFFTNSSSCESTSASPEYSEDEEPLETVISRVVKSDRLFFEPDQTNSILQEVVDNDIIDEVPFKESVVLEMESENPYVDFKRSMEEIVERHRLQDRWEHLEELLEWYLKVNGRKNHKYIIGAFVDLLVGISSKVNPCEATSSYSSALSSISSPSSFSRSCQAEKEITEIPRCQPLHSLLTFQTMPGSGSNGVYKKGLCDECSRRIHS